MDLADQAQQQNALAEAHNLMASRKPNGPSPTGYCLNCGEQFREDEPHKRWCNSQCRDDYERYGPAGLVKSLALRVNKPL